MELCLRLQAKSNRHVQLLHHEGIDLLFLKLIHLGEAFQIVGYHPTHIGSLKAGNGLASIVEKYVLVVVFLSRSQDWLLLRARIHVEVELDRSHHAIEVVVLASLLQI